MRKAIIVEATGVVENIVMANDDFDPGPGKLLRDAADARRGGTWDGAAYQPPPAPPPAPPDPQAELDAAITAARADYATAADQAGRDAAFLALCDALTGDAGRAGRVAGKPL